MATMLSGNTAIDQDKWDVFLVSQGNVTPKLARSSGAKGRQGGNGGGSQLTDYNGVPRWDVPVMSQPRDPQSGKQWKTGVVTVTCPTTPQVPAQGQPIRFEGLTLEVRFSGNGAQTYYVATGVEAPKSVSAA